ncbi:FHA domain-containing protein [Pleomassaria siparia CBS 279.74]|uniref:RING-type E3 ubiquitin transferase n=1 Tax=Pleomassaria siparia CBS 279.74 TaxID=1314801 RepID=A0A6G1JZB0_9PLEO|nr:FHA domain-containing protein [Pleomassaria siparia CBS 279.74]
MTRTRAETASVQHSVRSQSGPTPASVQSTPTVSMDSAEPSTAEGTVALKHLPSIRFIPHQDPRAGRPSLQFPTITRTLPEESNIIRVGRYSERDNIPDIPTNVPSAAAVGFKSKVVSRKHCELWCQDSQWYIKDVKSSSGTFLNHIRLSQPNVESKPFKLKDGDIIQLGIDFRGGEEMIFRCVKIRIECNRGWQQALNTFNKQTHQRLRNLANRKKDSDSASMHTSECSICLMSIAPCQSLFVAPCSHVWHYKCIRPILNGPTWPNFLCPNCRAVADLEADVEDPGEFEEWDDDAAQVEEESKQNGEEKSADRHVTPRSSTMPLINHAATADDSATDFMQFSDLEAAISNITIGESLNGIASQPVPNPSTPQRFMPAAPTSPVTQSVAINITGISERSGLSPLYPAVANALSPNGVAEGPMTPRNDAGPFVLDGSAGRASGRPREDDSSGSGPGLLPLRMD